MAEISNNIVGRTKPVPLPEELGKPRKKPEEIEPVTIDDIKEFFDEVKEVFDGMYSSSSAKIVHDSIFGDKE